MMLKKIFLIITGFGLSLHGMELPRENRALSLKFIPSIEAQRLWAAYNGHSGLSTIIGHPDSDQYVLLKDLVTIIKQSQQPTLLLNKNYLASREIVEAILMITDPNYTRHDQPFIMHPDSNSFVKTLVYYAAIQGFSETILFFISNGIQIDTIINNLTILETTIEHNQTDIALTLIDLGAAVNHLSITSDSTQAHFTPLNRAIRRGNVALTRALLSRGGVLGTSISISGAEPLRNASAIYYLLKTGRPSQAKLEMDIAYFFLAAATNDIVILENLLNRGVPINAQDREGNTALMLAAKYRNFAAYNYLTKRGASTCIRSNYNESPDDILRNACQPIESRRGLQMVTPCQEEAFLEMARIRIPYSFAHNIRLSSQFSLPQ